MLHASALHENFPQFAEGGEYVDDAQTGHGAPHEVVRQQGVQGGNGLAEVIPVPEGRPGNQDQEQARFEQEGDKQQTSEQSDLPFGLEFRQTQDPVRDVPVSTGFRFEFDEHGERSRVVARLLQRLSKSVQQVTPRCRVGCRRL